MQGIEIPIGAPLGPLNNDLNGAQKKLKGFTNTAETDLKSFSSTASSAFKTAGLALAGAFSVGAFLSFGKEVLSVTAEFEKFGAVLGNTLGSDALAKLKLKEIEEFAATTPFSIQELTSSFVKLANQGFKPTGDQMRSLGDLASSTGKSFEQLAEAILDAQTGEFERLKEFGITAQSSGDQVVFTFKGVQTAVDKSSESIRNYILSLGDIKGVSGSMDVITKTLTGSISELGDAWGRMLVSIGSNTSGVFYSAINLLSQAINKVTEFNKSLNTVSKFQLKSDWGEKLNRAINPFADKGSTSTEKAVYAIKQADNEVTKFVSGALAGAKSTSDFGNAIANLQKQGNAMIADFKMFAPQGLVGIKTTYEDGIKALKEGRTAFEIESKKSPVAKINLAAEKKAASEAAKLAKESAKNQAEIRVQGQAFAGKLVIDGFARNIEAEKLAIAKEFAGLDQLIEETNPFAKLFEKQDIANVKSLLTPFQNLKLVLQSEILPQLGTSFKTFFDDLLMNGKLSFETLGQAIKNTFLSVIASEATQGVLNLLGSKGGKTEKGSGLIPGIAGVLGIGKKAAAAIGGTAAVGGGTTAALAGGTAASGGLLLPILAGVAAVAGIASLFKKKQQAPLPQASSTISTTAAGSSQDFGGGRVIFEISGTNLIGVLNRAGAKLQRFGP